jgi:large repetitive protein
VPDKPINLSENRLLRTSSQISLSWSSGALDGGLPVLDYRINQKETGGIYFVIAQGITATTFLTSGLTLGTTYTYTVEARNDVGYSLVSDSLEILHALVPSKPDTPVTTND